MWPKGPAHPRGQHTAAMAQQHGAAAMAQQAYGYSLARVLDKKRDECVLRLLVELPGVASVQEIDLQLTTRVLRLEVATDARGALVIDLPEPVLLEPRAKFLKKTRQLRVDLVPATTLPLAEEQAAGVPAAAADTAELQIKKAPAPPTMKKLDDLLCGIQSWAAALKIQAVQRGRIARAEVADMRTGVMTPTSEFQACSLEIVKTCALDMITAADDANDAAGLSWWTSPSATTSWLTVCGVAAILLALVFIITCTTNLAGTRMLVRPASAMYSAFVRGPVPALFPRYSIILEASSRL